MLIILKICYSLPDLEWHLPHPVGRLKSVEASQVTWAASSLKVQHRPRVQTPAMNGSICPSVSLDPSLQFNARKRIQTIKIISTVYQLGRALHVPRVRFLVLSSCGLLEPSNIKWSSWYCVHGLSSGFILHGPFLLPTVVVDITISSPQNTVLIILKIYYSLPDLEWHLPPDLEWHLPHPVGRLKSVEASQVTWVASSPRRSNIVQES